MAKGEESGECEKFARYYRSLCPGEWVSNFAHLFLRPETFSLFFWGDQRKMLYCSLHILDERDLIQTLFLLNWNFGRLISGMSRGRLEISQVHSDVPLLLAYAFWIWKIAAFLKFVAWCSCWFLVNKATIWISMESFQHLHFFSQRGQALHGRKALTFKFQFVFVSSLSLSLSLSEQKRIVETRN